MSNVWDRLIELEMYFENAFHDTGTLVNDPEMDRFNQPGWVNLVWTGEHYRRAHIDVVDARATRGMWMMHCCVFPHTHNPAPIFGFDVVAGKNKITGCFIDYSPAGDTEHPMLDFFAEEAQQLEWVKTRKLPEWAERIFSGNMIAAGNVQSESELDQIISIGKTFVDHYVECVGETNNTSSSNKDLQNFYAENQKKNPHTPKVMTSLGLNEDDVRIFIEKCLFPEL